MTVSFGSLFFFLIDMTVSVVAVAVAVYCRLSEEWLFFHNKGQKNRWSSYIIRYCNIRPSNIKGSREKDINLTKTWPLLINIFIIMCHIVMRLTFK